MRLPDSKLLPIAPGSSLGWISTLSLFLIGVLAFSAFVTLELPTPNIFARIAIVFLSVLVHELGHAAGALAVRFRIQRFNCWPIELRRGPSGWSIHPSFGLSGPLGSVAVHPTDSGHFAARLGILTAAGPAASLLLAAAAQFNWAGVFSSPSWLDRETLALVSLTLGILSLLPYGGTDGASLLGLMRGGVDVTRLRAIFALKAASARGVRPRDHDAELIASAAAEPDATMTSLTGQAFQYNWLIENRRLEEAERVLLDLTAKSGTYAESWSLECAWLYARFLHDSEKANLWMEKAGAGEPSIGRFKAASAVALLEGRWQEADNYAKLTLKECTKLGDLGLQIALEEAAQDLVRDVAEARISSSSSSDFGQS